MSAKWTGHEAGVRWLEHELLASERRANDLATDIGSAAQSIRLLRPRAHRPEPSPAIVIAVTVSDCSDLPMAGVGVSATLSGVTYGATTDASGVGSITVPATGTYDVGTDAVTGYNSTGGSVVVTGPGTTPVARSPTVTAAYTCFDWEVGGVGSRRCGVFLRSRSFVLTDSVIGGPVTLTSGGRHDGDPTQAWRGAKSYAWPTCGSCSGRTITVTYEMVALASGGAGLFIGYPFFSGCPNAVTPLANLYFAGTCAAVDFSCLPFAATFHVTHAQLYCGATATITITD